MSSSRRARNLDLGAALARWQPKLDADAVKLRRPCPTPTAKSIYEPRELAAPKVLDKLAARVAPASVKRRIAEREAEREQQEQAWRDAQAAKLAAQRAKLEADEPIGCECCLRPIVTAADAAERHGALVHAGGCASQWGRATHDDEDD